MYVREADLFLFIEDFYFPGQLSYHCLNARARNLAPILIRFSTSSRESLFSQTRSCEFYEFYENFADQRIKYVE